MERVCIFCGQRPINKSKEHVIPKWLIKLTGNPKRSGFFGFYKEMEELKEMHLSFIQFTFPACDKCNEEYGKLEAGTKPVVLDLLDEKPLDSNNINLILTWFDKVRIGLWLGSLYYNNLFGVNPNFYINQGVFSRDRMIIIYKNKYDKKRLNFIGVHYAFQMHPICFTLIINNYAFTNIAKNLLLSEGFGLAVPQEEYISTSRRNLIVVKKGSQKILYPVVDFNFNMNCTEFYQPIIHESYSDLIFPMVNNDHRKKLFINEESGIGNVFFLRNGHIIEYPNKKNQLWVPPSFDMPFLEFFRFIGMQTLNIQNHYFTKNVRTYDSRLEPEFQRQKEFALLVNKTLYKRLEERDFEEFKS